MSRDLRSVLFLFFVAMFLIVGPAIVLWSQGYRYDFETRRIAQVGAIFLKTTPEVVSIAIGNPPAHGIAKEVKPSFLYTGTLIKNLLPKTYDVTVSAGPAYFSWAKTLSVAPLGVAKASHIFLLPKALQAQVFPLPRTPLRAIWPLPDAQRVLLQVTGSSTIFRLDLRDTRNTPTPLFNPTALTPQQSITEALVGADRRNMIFRMSDGDAILWLPNNPMPKNQARRMSRYLNRLLLESGAKIQSLKYYWHPTSANILYALAGSHPTGFYRVDTNQDEFQKINHDPLLAFGVGSANTYYLTRSGDFFRLNQNEEPSLIASYPQSQLPLGALFEVIEAANQNFILKRDDGALYVADSNVLVPIASHAHDVSLSPDRTKLVFTEDGKLWLYAIAPLADDLAINGKTKIFLESLPNGPKSMFWLSNNWNLVVVSGGGIDLLETDFRPPINSAHLDLGTLDQAFFNQDQTTLWALQNGALKSWQLTP